MFSNVTMTLLTQSLRENVSKYGSGCNTMFGMMIGSIAKAFRARSHHFHCRQHLMSMIQILPSGSTVVQQCILFEKFHHFQDRVVYH